MPSGQAMVQLTGTNVPPRFSLQESVCVCALVPSVQLPESGPPEMAPLPVAVTLWPKPLNAPVGGVQVTVVVAAAPVPEPAVVTEGVIESVPVLPTRAPPVAGTVVPVVGT